MKQLFKSICLCLVIIGSLFIASSCGEVQDKEHDDEIIFQDKYHCLSLEEAQIIAGLAGNVATDDDYNIYGVIKKVVSSDSVVITNGSVDITVNGLTSVSYSLSVGEEIVVNGNLQMVDGVASLVDSSLLEILGEGDIEIKPEPSDSIKDQFDCISVQEAIELAQEAGEAGTSEQYYVYGEIVNVENAVYGAMTISDGTGELYVYGVYSSDGETRYDAMEDRPVKGDEVVLCGVLKTYKDTPEMDRGYLQAFNHVEVEVDLSEYEEMSISSARNAKDSKLVKVTGVVAQITYAFGQVPNGFYLVDETGSIYIYGKDASGNVKVGNTVTIAGEKTFYISESELNNAIKYGYTGCCQIQNPILVSNDKGNSDFNKSWITETTVKNIMDTSYSENITTNIYKVNALVSRVDGQGFVNYYFDDLDGVTGSYVYTACSGADFAWLDEFDGKICTVYLSPINAKSTSSGCIYRFVPIEVVDDNFEFDQSLGAQFALDYYACEQFLPMYEADPALEVITKVSNELINLKDVIIRYSSSDENVGYFEDVEGILYFHTKNVGSTVITISAEYNGVEVSTEVVVEVCVPASFETITVKEAIETSDDTIVTVRGIVASSLVNQQGFYLIDETGIIAVTGNKDDIALLSVGDEVVVRGTKDHKIKDGYTGKGQINIYNSTILVNYYGDHEYSTDLFIKGKDVEYIHELDVNEDHSNEVYIIEAVVEYVKTPYYTSFKITSPKNSSVQLTPYCSGAAQYAFLEEFAGQTVTMEVAICNWNSKDYYAVCVMAVYTQDGKVINTLNFNE